MREIVAGLVRISLASWLHSVIPSSNNRRNTSTSRAHDHEDFTRASNRTRPYFFYEWLAAIVLHQSTGFLALVTRYQTDTRKRALLPDILPPDVLAVLGDRTRWGKTRGPIY
jgi:hypothetical protein